MTGWTCPYCRKTTAARIVSWDWKEQPDWERINRYAAQFDEPVGFVSIDTQSDSYAMLITTADLSAADVAILWDQYCETGRQPWETKDE